MGSRFFDRPIREEKIDRYQSLANPPIRVPLGPTLLIKKSNINNIIPVSIPIIIYDNQSSNIFLITEDGKWLTTEDGKWLVL